MAFTLFMKSSAAAALNSRIELSSKSFKCCWERTLTTYREAVNLSANIHSRHFNDKIDDEILWFTQTFNMTRTEFVEALWNKAPCCSLVYDEYIHKRIFNDGLQ